MTDRISITVWKPLYLGQSIVLFSPSLKVKLCSKSHWKHFYKLVFVERTGSRFTHMEFTIYVRLFGMVQYITAWVKWHCMASYG